MSEATIRALPIWKHGIEIAPLSGGLTNLNYRVVDGDRVFAVRTGDDDPRLGISRRNERVCTEAAAELGLAPKLIYGAPGILVSEFIEHAPMPANPDPVLIARIAAALRAIHDAGSEVVGHMNFFSPFHVARTYVRLATEGDLPLPAAPDELLAQLRELESHVEPFLPTFCHNDMMPGNILDTADRLWVIDWQYAGIGNPLFDLAGVSSNFELDAPADTALLDAYFGERRPAAEVGFRVMKAMAALRESLWAVLQGEQSEIDFDYGAYRDDNFQKYQSYEEALR